MAGFINPYHFVPLDKRAPQRCTIEEQRGSLYGDIECTLSIKTPLAIPDHEKEDKQQFEGRNHRSFTHSYFPFYSVDDHLPAIPGSEIRGMIRTVYEAETNSCMGVFDNAELHGRSQITKKNGGLIYKKDGTWFLEPAEVFVVNTFSDVNPQVGGQPDRYRVDYDSNALIVGNQRIANGSKIAFDKSRNTYKTADRNFRRGADTHMFFANNLGQGSQEGWLLIGERGLTTRHNSHILSPQRGAEIKIIDPETIDNLQTVLNLYRKKEINKTLQGRNRYNEIQHTGYASYTIKDNGDKTPVFYTQEGGHYYFSPAMKSREVYYRRLHEIAGDHVPCGIRSVINDNGDLKSKDEKDYLCPACALFGTVTDDAAIKGKKAILRNSYGSALRFSDATWDLESEPQWVIRNGSNKITLPELSGPKITSSEFYTHLDPNKESHADEVGVWNTDYKTRNVIENKGNREQRFTKIEPLASDSIILNGRKLYWHHPELVKDENLQTHLIPKVDIVTGDIRTERNITTQIIKNGQFRFRVFFDGINQEQLNHLLWALAPKSENRQLLHKLGFGKPLGLGSVEIRINNVRTREYINEHYCLQEHDEWIDKRECDKRTPFELIEMLDFERTGDCLVSYPIGKETERNGNITEGALIWFKYNRTIGTTAERPKVNYTLPVIKQTKDSNQRGYDLMLPSVIGGRFESLSANQQNGFSHHQNANETKPNNASIMIIGKCSKCGSQNVKIHPLLKMCENCLQKYLSLLASTNPSGEDSTK